MARVIVLPTDVVDILSAQLEQNTVGSVSGLRFLRLPHPRTGIPSLFLPYAKAASTSAHTHEILEIQAVTPPNPRSWLSDDNEVISDGKLLVMTPIDPAFLVLPLLQAIHPKEGSSFRPVEDMIEDAAKKLARDSVADAAKNPSLEVTEEDVMQLLQLSCVVDGVKRVCETKELTPEISVCRFATETAVEHMRSKVARLAAPGLVGKSRTMTRNLAKDGLMEDGKEQLLEVGRTRAACELLSQYLPPNIYAALLASYDFAVLDTHLAALQEADAAAIAAVEPSAAKPGKKSKSATAAAADGGKKRKTAASHGVEQLKKANTTGMKKISSFFGGKE